MFVATIAEGKTAASQGEGKNNCKNLPRVRFWMVSNWVDRWALVDLGKLVLLESPELFLAANFGSIYTLDFTKDYFMQQKSRARLV